jgi:hypothetical protein
MHNHPNNFRRDLLPPAAPFYRANVAKFRATGDRATGLCPFHKDSNPSLSLDLRRGLFHCFTCGTSGGGIIDFVMVRDSCSFKSACKTLGCWRDINESERQQLASEATTRSRERDRAAQVKEAERELRLGYRNTIHALERIVRETRTRMLTQDPSTSIKERAEEWDHCGHLLDMATDELREAVAAYYLLSFATLGERADFVLHPEERDAAIAAVLLRGTVRDDSGHVVELCYE